MAQDKAKLKALLDKEYQWPCLFAFKFIVLSSNQEELKNLFKDRAVKTEVRPSSQGKYLAFTFHCMVSSSDEVFSTYGLAQGISGLLAL